MKKLEEMDLPGDLKKMSGKELDNLAVMIREFLIDKVSVTGGHIASNLGVVELSIALHRVFDSPRDKIVWDVGHQSYVHKILTGRADLFDGLRQRGGISGFPKKSESAHDVFDTGHASSSLSIAAGLAAGRDIKGDNYQVISVIGDGALTGGLAYEALNNIGAGKSKVIVILNDNGMSISQNVGGMSDHLNDLRTSSSYTRAKTSVKTFLSGIPKVGKNMSHGISEFKEVLKYAVLPQGVLFEEMGFTYIGPVDGHDIRKLSEVLQRSKNLEGPVLIHIMTKKGKGYRNAEKDPNKFHGIAPFDRETGLPLKQSGTSYSDVMGSELVKLAEKDDRICAITAAMCTATGLEEFSEKFPERFFDVGIAEEHAVTFAGGLASSGLKPVVAIYSSFLQRAYDEIMEDVALQRVPVVFAIDRAGIVGQDGETHQGIFDISYLSTIPGMTIFSPSSGEELRKMLGYALEMDQPCAIRYPRGVCPEAEPGNDFDGNDVRLFTGKDADIFAVGPMVSSACEARNILADSGIDVGVVLVRRPHPAGTELINEKVPVFTMEDGIKTGGYGEQLRAAASKDTDITISAFPDQFIGHGKVDELYEEYGLDGKSMAEKVRSHLEGKD